MSLLYKMITGALLLSLYTASHAQDLKPFKGKIVDSLTLEPIAGATIHCTMKECNCGCTSDANGGFHINCSCNNACTTFVVRSVGYQTVKFNTSDATVIYLRQTTSYLENIVITANRGESAKRSETPVAIASVNAKTIQETKATTADQLLNKVSGVNMVSLGNEQHQMSIRQPITTRSLFLYLEDGIPVRTSGLFNHNAILEMNMAAVKTIEVIKGPSSSLYGSEAIGGVVNFITAAPAALPVLKLSLQGNNIGYKRVDFISSLSHNKWGFSLSGYHAQRRNGFIEYSDFNKGTITARADYRFSGKTQLSNSISWFNYYSDMSGSIDSIMFASKVFQNLQTFTYRKVNGIRYHSTLSHNWTNQSRSTVTVLYRDNLIGQNPAYRVKDDYRRVGSVFIGKKDLAHGEINESVFKSYAVMAQHRQELKWKRAAFITGISMDLSPSGYDARYLRIKKDTISRKYVSYQNTDSSLTDYSTRLNNYAAFMHFEFYPFKKMKIVASLRYDYFHYVFDNNLQPSAFSGSSDTLSSFKRLSPKIGFTYNFSSQAGLYANYSEGFVPPQVTELYTGVKVPDLNASVFYNYEMGGWLALFKNKLYADVSIYHLQGTNEIISVKLDDGSFANQNAGKTLHRGIELGLNILPLKDISFRISGACSQHKFVQFVEKGISYNGNEMNNAPRYIYNTELWFKPSCMRGWRLGAEMQHVGKYFTDPQNTATYKGYNVLNLRIGYQLRGLDIWLNVLNVTDNYYSYLTSKSSFAYSYQLAEPRNFNLGLAYDFAKFIKTKK